MSRLCRKCNDHELTVSSRDVFRHAAKPFSKLVNVETEYICPSCEQVTRQHQIFNIHDAHRIGLLQPSPSSTEAVNKYHVVLFGSSYADGRCLSISYPSVYRSGENILYPRFEGNIQDGTVINSHGDPDLMLKFAEQYLNSFHRVMPKDRLPTSLAEMMPALSLLVIATELGLKAYLIRDDKTGFGHSLEQLYDCLLSVHREEIERRFSKLAFNTNLVAMGVDAPSVKSILQIYDNTYGGESKVYLDTRYLAEPTTKYKSNSLRGMNIVKSETPYPIFLPDIIGILFDVYRFYSGHERLRRLGGDVCYGTREPGNDNHGDWGVVPSSLDLVVLTVPQPAGKSAKGDDLIAFNQLLSDNPPFFQTDWMHGGETLLFYADGGRDYLDGRVVFSNVACRVWRYNRLGMHARDLNLLANALESESELSTLPDMP